MKDLTAPTTPIVRRALRLVAFGAAAAVLMTASVNAAQTPETPETPQAPAAEEAPAVAPAPAVDPAPAADSAPASDVAPAAAPEPATDPAPAAETAPVADPAPAAEPEPAAEELPPLPPEPEKVEEKAPVVIPSKNGQTTLLNGNWSIRITPAPRPQTDDASAEKLAKVDTYKQIYDAIPYRRADYLANPNYRHDTAVEILFGEMRPTVIHRQDQPQRVVNPRPQIFRPDMFPYIGDYRKYYWRSGLYALRPSPLPLFPFSF
ncbi:hypothetical protein AB1L42_17290 [Thalassoglobus sp. JC818]|uniref:hypothetical protein n=1 Tax=Thalassoglobus sp. JC818 TaxID=3232136 RepID=UPI003457AEFA